ncbi:MAG: bifunctional (p)ppGpp synthetase/guanosine-3',5'-bis(diphosphate) 3'-pyrophosphohydrolase [Firmicutes bacterium]|nr:bifunctional (p)ppGpp synthetase/guanosine-3',5'-bis(diphosphate) 3'-pyrophosphohydrolase [Bacillota bacterium]
MKSKTYEDLINLVKVYNPDEVSKVAKAYEVASKIHQGQYRQSGEEYIIHPVNVAYILAQMHADGDTLCAGLLHDVIEDGDITKEEIAELFNPTVAQLVDGVTKLSVMSNASKHKLNCASTRKIITSMMEDVRVIIIKLADRLHNMRTLEFKKPEKQKENAYETLDIFVPFAYYIGAYEIKSELEDLSFRYINPSEYQKTEIIRNDVKLECSNMIEEMISKINYLLNHKNIAHQIYPRIKNVFGVYKKLQAGKSLPDIKDLIALKILVKEVDECYVALGILNSAYHPLEGSIKDYICNPKTNLYQSLHTTMIGPEGKYVHGQIRTCDMDRVAAYGLSASWDIEKGGARDKMQEKLKNELQFYRSLKQINAAFTDDEEFMLQIKNELFGNKVYVYTDDGEVIELPVDATPVDFAYQIHSDIGNHLVGAMVNGQTVPLDTKLHNKDRIYVVCDENASPSYDWQDFVVTTRAKKKMREYLRKNV